MGIRLSKLKSPTYKKCANPDCNEMFWGYGTEKYHCDKCKAHARYLRNKDNIYRWREKHPAIMKEYTVKNKEQIKKYHDAHKKEIKKYWKKYYKKNKVSLLKKKRLDYKKAHLVKFSTS